MAVAAQKIGAVLVGDEQEKIGTGGFRHCTLGFGTRCASILRAVYKEVRR
jgi:hypothetical protein